MGFGPFPPWLEIQGLTEESLRAVVTELGIEIFGALCARAEPALVRDRLCSLSARKFTFTMYVELCRYMESCRVRRGPGRTVAMETGGLTGGPHGVLRIRIEDQGLVDPEEKGRLPEDGKREKLVGKFPCISCSQDFTNKAALQRHMKRHRPVSTGDKKQQHTPGHHAQCYRHFSNITTIEQSQESSNHFSNNRAIGRRRRKNEADKIQEEDADALLNDKPLDPAPKRLLRSDTSDGQQTSAHQHTDKRHVLPVQCIICKGSQYIKEQYSGKRKVEKLVRCETKHGGQLLTAATMKQDEALLLHIRDQDLVAIEARYHKSCYLRYIRIIAKSLEVSKQECPQQLYEKSYIRFCKKVIEERIIRGKEILRLSKLNRLFIKEVQEIGNTDASSYKTGRLKARLRRSYPSLCFARPSRQMESDIVFVESLAIEEVVERTDSSICI
uniref:uncharacterized protein isoform X2 n=1 Tax=Myxine glutinosa TaxID=7769 RepID=UPI00358E82AD